MAVDPPRRHIGAWRRVVAAIGGALVIAGLASAPIAVAGHHSHRQLVEVDRFVETFSPLAHDPLAQGLLVDTTVERINVPGWLERAESEIAALTGGSLPSFEVPGWLSDSARKLSEWGLPSWLADPLIPGPLKSPVTSDDILDYIAEAIEETVESSVSQLVGSKAFSIAWEQALATSHGPVLAKLQEARFGEPPAALSLDIQPILIATKDALVAADTPYANFIPTEWEYTATLVPADQMGKIGPYSSLAIRYGEYVPWVSVALVLLGLALVARRLRWFAIGAATLTLVSAGALVAIPRFTPARDTIAQVVSAQFIDAISPYVVSTLATVTAAGAAATVIGAGIALWWRTQVNRSSAPSGWHS